MDTPRNPQRDPEGPRNKKGIKRYILIREWTTFRAPGILVILGCLLDACQGSFWARITEQASGTLFDVFTLCQPLLAGLAGGIPALEFDLPAPEFDLFTARPAIPPEMCTFELSIS